MWGRGIIPMRKTDRRSRRTQRWLRDAFLGLMLEKDYAAITVQEIADRADTARVTFYRHYPGGKEDLLTDWLDLVYGEIFDQLAPVAEADLSPIARPGPLAALYRHIDANRALYRVLLADPVGALVRGRIQAHLAAALARALNAQFTLKFAAIPLDLMANHMAAAYLGLAVWWLENDIPYDPDFLARAAHQLNMGGVLGALTGQTSQATATQTVYATAG